MNDVYDVPVFKSLPSLINFNRNIDNNILSKKLYNISITDIYEDEPFTNNNNNKYFLLILYILILVIIFILFCTL